MLPRMKHVEYPRLANETVPRRDPGAGLFLILTAFVSILEALEAAFIGEELAPLGERLYVTFGSDYSVSTPLALLALGLAIFRVLLGIGLARGVRPTYIALPVSILPFIVLDYASWSLPLGLGVISLDVLVSIRCVHRLRSGVV